MYLVIPDIHGLTFWQEAVKDHETAYLSDLLPATCRYDHSRSKDIRTCLMDNLDLFSLAHEEIVGGRRVVFSHAGITREWLRDNE